MAYGQREQLSFSVEYSLDEGRRMIPGAKQFIYRIIYRLFLTLRIMEWASYLNTGWEKMESLMSRIPGVYRNREIEFLL